MAQVPEKRPLEETSSDAMKGPEANALQLDEPAAKRQKSSHGEEAKLGEEAKPETSNDVVMHELDSKVPESDEPAAKRMKTSDEKELKVEASSDALQVPEAKADESKEAVGEQEGASQGDTKSESVPVKREKMKIDRMKGFQTLYHTACGSLIHLHAKNIRHMQAHPEITPLVRFNLNPL